jgi:hypothetical protein
MPVLSGRFRQFRDYDSPHCDEEITAGEFASFNESLPEQVRRQARGSTRQVRAFHRFQVAIAVSVEHVVFFFSSADRVAAGWPDAARSNLSSGGAMLA